ncbi:MAG TPA: hypothetical protein VNU47_02605 [Candidatus Paceibacterota bacterium]|nr:hypothetical protein [Candidatus Paceibacterota bacterium]
MESMKEPVAIITSGGGMKCAYSAGALVTLAQKLGITSPDIFVAASGSTGSMFYYLTGQYDDIKKAWTRYLPSKHFISYGPVPSMKINYLIDTVSKEYLPLDTRRLEETKTRYLVPVTDQDSGETRFIGNELWFNPYEVMRAATAIPILYNGHVRLGSRSYLDGDFSTGVATLIKKAIDVGAKRILLITNTDAPTRAGKAILRAYGALLRPGLRKALIKDLESDQSIRWPDGLKFVCISPTLPLPTLLYTRERRKVIESFTMGADDLLAKRDEIEALFRP